MSDLPLVSEESLARTYDGSVYDDAWQAVLDYRRVRQYQADHPNAGYTAIANTLELPIGRVRSWYDGKTPNVVAGLETAHDHRWIALEYDGPQFGALNTLVAGVFSGGSVAADNWVPQFTLNEHGYGSPVIDALESAAVGHVDCESPRGNRSLAVRPARDGAVLGRVLATLGAPIGKKSELETLSLPPYLDEAPDDVRERFVRTYLLNRGYEDRTSDTIQIIEQRPASYRRELANLIESVADAPVRAGEQSVTLSADAARALEVAPRYAAGE